jgi:hypothetical protein
MHQHFGVAARLERMPPGGQLRHQLGVIEDLAVVDDPDLVRFIGEGLATLLQIHDGKARVRETDAGVQQVAELVGPAVPQSHDHRLQLFAGGRGGVIQIDDARNAAHVTAASAGAARKVALLTPCPRARLCIPRASPWLAWFPRFRDVDGRSSRRGQASRRAPWSRCRSQSLRPGAAPASWPDQRAGAAAPRRSPVTTESPQGGPARAVLSTAAFRQVDRSGHALFRVGICTLNAS